MLFCGAICEARDGSSAAGGPHHALSATVPYSERRPVAGQCPSLWRGRGRFVPRSRASFVGTGFPDPLSPTQGPRPACIAPARRALYEATRRDTLEPSQPPTDLSSMLPAAPGGGLRTTPWGLVSA